MRQRRVTPRLSAREREAEEGTRIYFCPKRRGQVAVYRGEEFPMAFGDWANARAYICWRQSLEGER